MIDLTKSNNESITNQDVEFLKSINIPNKLFTISKISNLWELENLDVSSINWIHSILGQDLDWITILNSFQTSQESYNLSNDQNINNLQIFQSNQESHDTTNNGNIWSINTTWLEYNISLIDKINCE